MLMQNRENPGMYRHSNNFLNRIPIAQQLRGRTDKKLLHKKETVTRLNSY
jgi:hypothetical protein